jgi:RhtB (resistance to homoserine/threonine) family protein
MDFLTLDWTSLIAILTINMIALISPGPDFAITVKNSLLYSRRVGLWCAFGITCGEVIHLFYTILGFGLIVSQTLWLFGTIKLLGAVYLIYSGYKSLKSRKGKKLTDNSQADNQYTNSAAFRSGFLTNLLNPKAILFFLSIFTVVIDPKTPLSTMVFYGSLMTFQTFLWFGLVALCFSWQKIRDAFAQFNHWVERITGGVLVMLGIKLAFMANR